MCQLGDLLQIRDVVSRVADTLHIHSLRLVVDESRELLGVVPVHKLGVNAQTREHDLELVVRAPVQVGG